MPYKDPEDTKAAYRRYNATDKGKKRGRKFWRQRYNLSDEGYAALIEAQGFKCAICQNEFSDKPRSVNIDHCHITLKVRGLLCGRCNRGIGLLKDNPTRLRLAAEYLEKNNGDS